MTQEKILVIEKDGSSYIKVGYNRGLLINGNPLNLCPGNNDWAMIDGKVEKIEQILQTPTNYSY